MDDRVRTIRQMMVEALEGGLLSAKDLSRAVGVMEKEVATHLLHVARSRHDRGDFVVEPSRCLGCGFVFKKRQRLKTPGRCPVCRSEEITETRFGIRRQQHGPQKQEGG